jgi:hypothetical protein
VSRDAAEERESLGSWERLIYHVRLLWERLLARFRRSGPSTVAGSEDDLAALRGHPEFSGTLTVRQIYARLQALAARSGYPRQPYTTPIEYLRVLSSAMPGLSPDLQAITLAYLEARYGPRPASAAAVTAANIAWQRLEPALQRENLASQLGQV